MTTVDDIGTILAAEEYRQGLPYIAGDHCDDCREVDRAWQQATCEHANTVDISELCKPNQRLCDDCGTEMDQ